MKVQNAIEIEKFKATPDITIYGRLGKVGYNLRDAISELVDNSIDARVPGEQLKIKIELDEVTGEVVVKDDGVGMTKEVARDAIILGKSTKKDKLGLFGLGLKTAALSLGNVFTIRTKQKHSNEENLIEFDRKEFERLNNWELSMKSYPSTNNDFISGTEIIISDLLFTPTYKKSDRLNEYLAERYRSFINSGEIEIVVEGTKCIPLQNTYVMEEPISIKTELGNLINGFLRIQTKRSQKKQEYGFDLYKNKRIVESFSKLGVGFHAEKALICGELNFDFCQVNFTKNSFLQQTNEYKAAEKALKDYLRPLIPIFTSKNLDKYKIHQLLELQKKNGKIPCLNQFKKLINSLDGENLGYSVCLPQKTADLKNEDLALEEDLKGMPKSIELGTQMQMNVGSLKAFFRIIEEIKDDEETLQKISTDDTMDEKLSVFAEILRNITAEIENLRKKAGQGRIKNESRF